MSNSNESEIFYLVMEQSVAANGVDIKFTFLACTHDFKAAKALAKEKMKEGRNIIIDPFYNELAY